MAGHKNTYNNFLKHDFQKEQTPNLKFKFGLHFYVFLYKLSWNVWKVRSLQIRAGGVASWLKRSPITLNACVWFSTWVQCRKSNPGVLRRDIETFHLRIPDRMRSQEKIIFSAAQMYFKGKYVPLIFNRSSNGKAQFVINCPCNTVHLTSMCKCQTHMLSYNAQQDCPQIFQDKPTPIN